MRRSARPYVSRSVTSAIADFYTAVQNAPPEKRKGIGKYSHEKKKEKEKKEIMKKERKKERKPERKKGRKKERKKERKKGRKREKNVLMNKGVNGMMNH